MMNCPKCEAELEAKVRKEKYKSETGHKLAVNLTIYVCNDCEEEFIDEEDQRIYQERCKNYAQKVKNSLN